MPDGLLMILMGVVLWRFAKQAEHHDNLRAHNRRLREAGGPVRPVSTQTEP